MWMAYHSALWHCLHHLVRPESAVPEQTGAGDLLIPVLLAVMSTCKLSNCIKCSEPTCCAFVCCTAAGEQSTRGAAGTDRRPRSGGVYIAAVGDMSIYLAHELPLLRRRTRTCNPPSQCTDIFPRSYVVHCALCDPMQAALLEGRSCNLPIVPTHHCASAKAA